MQSTTLFDFLYIFYYYKYIKYTKGKGGPKLFTYKPLWKLLLERDMNKQDLRKALGFGPSTIAKMGKGEYVSLEVIDKICTYFGVPVEDVIEHIPDPEENEKTTEE